MLDLDLLLGLRDLLLAILILFGLLAHILLLFSPLLSVVFYVGIYRKLVFVEKRKYLTRHQLKKELVYHVLFLLYAALVFFCINRGQFKAGTEGVEFSRLFARFLYVGCPYSSLFILRYGIIIVFRGVAWFRRTGGQAIRRSPG